MGILRLVCTEQEVAPGFADDDNVGEQTDLSGRIIGFD